MRFFNYALTFRRIRGQAIWIEVFKGRETKGRASAGKLQLSLFDVSARLAFRIFALFKV
jgi:hypothetical protein